MLYCEAMQESDIEDVRELERLSFNHTWQEGSFRNELKNNPCAIYLVLRSREQPGALLGYAGLWLVHDEAHITAIAVSPQLRAQGAGKRLLFSLLCAARRKGARWATLEVRDDNLPAQKLYRRFGFAKVGTRKAYYENQIDGWIMWGGNLLSERYQERLREIASASQWPDALAEMEVHCVES